MFVFFSYLDEGALCPGGGGGRALPHVTLHSNFFLRSHKTAGHLHDSAGHLVKKPGLSRQKLDCPGKSGTFGRSVYLL